MQARAFAGMGLFFSMNRMQGPAVIKLARGGLGDGCSLLRYIICPSPFSMLSV